jgi:hypothetical protein
MAISADLLILIGHLEVPSALCMSKRNYSSSPRLGGEDRMHAVRTPILTTIPIRELRPTQITVGMREVEAKRRRWREKSEEKGAKFLGHHMRRYQQGTPLSGLSR